MPRRSQNEQCPCLKRADKIEFDSKKLKIFNCVVTQFGDFIRNNSESLMNGITTRRRIVYHFDTFGAKTTVFVEARLHIRSNEDRSNVVALVIAGYDGQGFLQHRSSHQVFEPTACDWSNIMLCDGSTKPCNFSMGVVRGSRFCAAGGLALDGFSSKPAARPFIHSLCPIYKTIFNLLVVAYVTSLKVFYDHLLPESRDTQEKSSDR
ncbi:uncharacterized protein BJ212DRAFT_1303201 [Suillus subaureus]|uniref:Uncharacterized protein n=1 Tax=Suillus subaureus TaxID=48587 RepID=A0A9P7J8C3_9AGAM|nr:uncharacterized protein BJ212DRAFT_1303201 [Suillus subaureus]KAG1808011.1 hypothetical protein BJ212DRAFT_1303201 [Suillus subaureus]